MGIANIINVTGSAGGGEIIRELINSSDGQGLHFNGAAGNFTATPPDMGSKFSFELVVSSSDWNASCYFIDFHTGGRFIFGSNDSEIAIYDQTSWKKFGVQILDDNNVHHLVVTVDGTAAVLYDNGNQVATQTIGTGHNIDSCSALSIGPGATGTPISLYRCRFYNKALTQAEVDNAYQRADVPFADQYGSQTSLVDANASTFVGTSTYGWVKYGNNTIANTSNQLVITYVDNVQGAYNYLKDSTDLTTNLTVGKKYKVKIDAKYAGGSAGVKLRIANGVATSEFATLTTSLTTYEVEFTAQSATGCYINLGDMSASNVVTLDNFYVYSCGVVTDYDLAFANPTQSLMVQDRAGAADGTATATGVIQTQPIVQLNSTSARIGTSAATPSDNSILVQDLVQSERVIVKKSTGSGNTVLKVENDSASNAGVINIEGKRTSDNDCAQIQLSNSGEIIAAIKGYRSGANDAGKLELFTSASGTTGLTSRMAIDSSGNVLVNGGGYIKIGPSDSTAQIQLYRNDSSIADGNAVGDIKFGGADANNDTAARIRCAADGADWTATSSPTRLEFGTTPSGSETVATRMTISAAGLVTVKAGVDDTFESGLQVIRSANSDSIWMNCKGGAANFNTKNNAGSAGLAYKFLTNGTERMAISSAGLVSINNATTITGTDNSSSRIRLVNTATSPDNVWSIGSNYNSQDLLIAPDDGAAVVTISDAGLATFTGGIAFSQTNTSASGATATSTTLNHFESGTWTATLGGAIPATVANVTGYYTRIGDTVHVWYYSGSLTSDGSAAVITGLPFTVNASAYGGFFTYHNTYCPTASTGYFSVNTATGYFTAANSTASANSANASGRYIMFTGTYKV